MIIDEMWLREFFYGRNVYVTLQRKDESMEANCTLIIVIKNG
jgi:hypothetical protein